MPTFPTKPLPIPIRDPPPATKNVVFTNPNVTAKLTPAPAPASASAPTPSTPSTPKQYFKHPSDIPDLELDDLVKNIPIETPKLSKAEEMAIHVEKVRALLKNNITQIEIMKKELSNCFDAAAEEGEQQLPDNLERTAAGDFEELISQILPSPEQLGTIKQATSRLLNVLPKSKSSDILSALFG